MNARRRFRVGFICVRNSCRSQMAEALAKRIASDIIDPVSGGPDPAERVDPGAVESMKEIGIDISNAKPKKLPNETLDSLDLIVHMGCETPGLCLTVPGKPNEDWGIDDPVGESPRKYREIRNTIERKVRELADRLRSGGLRSDSIGLNGFRIEMDLKRARPKDDMGNSFQER